jgi:hypothetical protein
MCLKHCQVWGVCVTNDNGFWIRWLDFIGTCLQLQPIMTAHNQWLPKTRSIPYWTASVFYSTVTNEERRIIAHSYESELLYDWRFTANQLVLATSPLRLTTSILFIQLNACYHSPYVTSSLTRGWVCPYESWVLCHDRRSVGQSVLE